MALPLSIRTRAALEATGIPAPPLTIEETTGPRRRVVLRGRSMPYRGVTWEGEQRVEIKYFPGNPVGFAQILGHTFSPTTMRGVWRDAYLADQDSRVELGNFPPVATTARPGSGFTGGPSFASSGSVPGGTGYGETARVVRDALEMIKRSGQLLRVQWGSLVRFGFLKRTAWTHGEPTGGESDIGWEMDFEWIGDTNAVPRPKVPSRLDTQSLAAQLVAAVNAAVNQLAGAVQAIYSNYPAVIGPFLQLSSAALETLDALEALAGVVLIPAQTVGVVSQQLGALVLASKALADAVRAVPAGYLVAKDGGSPVDINSANGVANAIAANALALGIVAADGAKKLADQVTPDILGFAVATGAETLRDLAYRYYGDPEQWGPIYSYNGLTSTKLVRGQTVVIPRLG